MYGSASSSGGPTPHRKRPAGGWHGDERGGQELGGRGLGFRSMDPSFSHLQSFEGPGESSRRPWLMPPWPWLG